jgi:hypothetical protein
VLRFDLGIRNHPPENTRSQEDEGGKRTQSHPEMRIASAGNVNSLVLNLLRQALSRFTAPLLKNSFELNDPV